MIHSKNKIDGYWPRKQALELFDELLVAMRKRGDALMPPERELGKILKCSRETARRVLELKESDGVIVKKGRDRVIPFSILSGRKAPVCRFAFVAPGSSIIGNPAWGKLWSHLQVKAEAIGTDEFFTGRLENVVSLDNHAAGETGAEMIVEKIKEMLKGGGGNIGLNKVKPSFHQGSTLR